MERRCNLKDPRAAGFLKRFLADFPHPVHAILTDSGAEFTGRFAVYKKKMPALVL